MKTYYNDAYTYQKGRWYYAHDKSLVPNQSTVVVKGQPELECPDLLIHNLLTTSEVGDIFGIAASSVSKYVKRGIIPHPHFKVMGVGLWIKPIIEDLEKSRKKWAR